MIALQPEIEAFLTELRTTESVSKSTLLAYASDLRAFMAFLANSIDRSVGINELKPQKISAFLEAEKNAGLKRSTLTRRLVTLRRFITYLENRGVFAGHELIESAHIYEVIDSARREQPALCLSDDQIARLLETMNRFPRPRALRDQAILMLMLETGFSVGQLTALDLEDLDLTASRVYVTSTDNLQQWYPLGKAQVYLEHYLYQGRSDLIRDSRETALFVSQKDGRLSRQGIWQILNHWGQLVDPPIPLSPRLVRRTAVQRMVHRGRPLKEIQNLLGHDNPLSTRALIRRLLADCETVPESLSNFESDRKTDVEA